MLDWAYARAQDIASLAHKMAKSIVNRNRLFESCYYLSFRVLYSWCARVNFVYLHQVD